MRWFSSTVEIGGSGLYCEEPFRSVRSSALSLSEAFRMSAWRMGFGGSCGGRAVEEEAGDAVAVVFSDDDEGGGGSGGGTLDVTAGDSAGVVGAGARVGVAGSVRDGFGGNEGMRWTQIDGCSAMRRCNV